MLATISQLFHRTALLFMLVASPMVVINAGKFDCGSDLIPASLDSDNDTLASNDRSEIPEEELCGWATHDSCPIPHPLSDRSMDDLDIEVQPIPLAALAGLASRGVHIEQWVEPFAMVGPFVTNSFSDIDRLEAFWTRTIETAEELARRDAEMPIDAVQVEIVGQTWPRRSQVASHDVDAIEITPIDPLVGSSPIVYSIADAPGTSEYQPYDLAEWDLPLWNTITLPSQPLVARSLPRRSWDPSLDNADNANKADAWVAVPVPDAIPHAFAGEEDLIVADVTAIEAAEASELAKVKSLISAAQSQLAGILRSLSDARALDRKQLRQAVAAARSTQQVIPVDQIAGAVANFRSDASGQRIGKMIASAGTTASDRLIAGLVDVAGKLAPAVNVPHIASKPAESVVAPQPEPAPAASDRDEAADSLSDQAEQADSATDSDDEADRSFAGTRSLLDRAGATEIETLANDGPEAKVFETATTVASEAKIAERKGNQVR